MKTVYKIELTFNSNGFTNKKYWQNTHRADACFSDKRKAEIELERITESKPMTLIDANVVECAVDTKKGMVA